MNVNEVLLANFVSSSETRAFFKEFSPLLGLAEQYRVARLAIGRSLGEGGAPGPAPDARGSGLKGHFLFGSDERDHLPWIGLLCEHALQHDMKVSLHSMQTCARDHWHRGCVLLREDWVASNEDFDAFVQALARRAALPEEVGSSRFASGSALPRLTFAAAIPITLRLGIRVGSSETESWRINGRGYSPNVAIMGQVGSGKTFAMLGFLKQVRQQAPVPILLIDAAKDELADNAELTSLGLEVRKVPSQPMPLDIFHDCHTSSDIARDAAVAFAESLDRALTESGLTANQKPRVVEALRPLLERKKDVTLADVQSAIVAHYEMEGIKEDRVIAILKTINFYTLTQPQLGPDEFFSKSWLLTFGGASEDTRRLTVFLLFDALDRYLKSLPEALLDADGNRALRLILAIDEARPLLAARHAGLSNLVRTHRSKGLAVMLASQSPDDYDGQSDDFMQQIGLPVCFRTNSTANAVLNNMFKSKRGVNFSALDPGQCLTVVNNSSVLLKTY